MIDSQFFRFVVKAFQEFQSWIFNESFNSYLEVFYWFYEKLWNKWDGKGNNRKGLKRSVYFWHFFHLIIHRETNIPFQSMKKIMEWWIKQRVDIELIGLHQMQPFNVVIFFFGNVCYIEWWIVKSNKNGIFCSFYRNIIYNICLSLRDRTVLSR